MIEFVAPAHEDPALVQAPLFRGALLTLRYIVEHGPIGLTENKALKRYFVTWAAETFDWAYYTADDLYAVNKVLNEHDFPPLVVLHDLLVSAKLARHRKGFLHITKTGKDLLQHPGNLWIALAHHILFVLDHSRYTRYGDELAGDWLLFLNIINVEAHTGLTYERFAEVLFGAGPEDHWAYALAYIHILRPLCWLGLLDETRHGKPYPTEKLFTKTVLWPRVIQAESDKGLLDITRH